MCVGGGGGGVPCLVQLGQPGRGKGSEVGVVR